MENGNLGTVVKEYGSLYIEVFQPNEPMIVTKGGTVYKLTPDMKAEELFSYTEGHLYLGVNRDLYWVNSAVNAVTDVTENRSAQWWDYEIMKEEK